MGLSSIECGDFGVALRMLPFGLDARLLAATIEVLLEALDNPHITPKQGNRWGDIAAFVGPSYGIVANIKQGFQILRGHDAEKSQP
jgi:hypothetical protein